jgi:hypothetical protein
MEHAVTGGHARQAALSRIVRNASDETDGLQAPKNVFEWIPSCQACDSALSDELQTTMPACQFSETQFAATAFIPLPAAMTMTFCFHDVSYKQHAYQQYTAGALNTRCDSRR